MAAREGFEPSRGSSKGSCLTTWLPGNECVQDVTAKYSRLHRVAFYRFII